MYKSENEYVWNYFWFFSDDTMATTTKQEWKSLQTTMKRGKKTVQSSQLVLLHLKWISFMPFVHFSPCFTPFSFLRRFQIQKQWKRNITSPIESIAGWPLWIYSWNNEKEENFVWFFTEGRNGWMNEDNGASTVTTIPFLFIILIIINNEWRTRYSL